MQLKQRDCHYRGQAAGEVEGQEEAWGHAKSCPWLLPQHSRGRAQPELISKFTQHWGGRNSPLRATHFRKW